MGHNILPTTGNTLLRSEASWKPKLLPKQPPFTEKKKINNKTPSDLDVSGKTQLEELCHIWDL